MAQHTERTPLQTWGLAEKTVSEPRPVARLQILPVIVAAVITLSALAVWVLALHDVDITRMSDLGLVSILPDAAFAALGLLTISLCLALYQQRPNTLLLFLNVGVLIFMLYGITALLEPMPRFAVTWRHFGVTQFIRDMGRVDPDIDAYFNWPGFFALNAFLADTAGLHHILSFGSWAPVFFNLLYLGPLLMIFSSLTEDRRVVWLAVWMFYLTNWIAQDYFSPQALAYFMYLVTVAVVIRWFKTTAPEARRFLGLNGEGMLARWANTFDDWLALPELPNAPSASWQRAGLLLILVTIFAMVVATHQLTPFAILLMVSALVFFRRSSLRGLPVIMAILLAVWVSYVAAAYMKGHLPGMIQELGQVNSSVSANVSSRVAGSPDHVLIVRVRLVFTLALWGLAVLGGLLRWRKGYGDATLILLAFTPFGLAGMQDYGGEILLRIYLFSLPIMVFLAASVPFLLPRLGALARSVPVIALLTVSLLAGFLFSRYGNERMDYKTRDEIDAVRFLYNIAPANSLWLSATSNVAWKFEDYDKHHYRTVLEQFLLSDVNGLLSQMRNTNYSNAYVVLTRSQQVNAELFYGVTLDDWTRFEQALTHSGKLRLVFRNHDAAIFGMVDNTGSEGRVRTAAEPLPKEPWTRPLFVLSFLLLVPGGMAVRMLHFRDPLTNVVLSIALSISIVTLLATAMVYAEQWKPEPALIGLVAVSILLGGLEWLRGRRHPAGR